MPDTAPTRSVVQMTAMLIAVLLTNLSFAQSDTAADPQRTKTAIRSTHSLDGTWDASLDGGKTWNTILVPGAIEDQLDVDFDGVSRYRVSIPTQIPESRLAILRFEAVATYAEVRLDGQLVGTHLGGWTPFEFDVTEILQNCKAPHCRLEVKVDERVGHNTQGFLPIIAPHFSGIWQSVRLDFRPAAYVSQDRLHTRGDSTRSEIEIEAPVVESENCRVLSATARYRRSRPNQPETAWSSPTQLTLDTAADHTDNLKRIRGRLAVPNPELWSPASPVRYEVELSITSQNASGSSDAATYRAYASFRELKTHRDQIVLNGKTVFVRGVLNWGYAPPRTAPTLDESWMREEIEFAQQRGFNLMKFCLWIPPKRYLELCDEMGMLAWVEYPAWHPDFSEKHLADLRREYTEFFHYDRNHPSVILRSLTCETGPGADLKVIQSLYDRCKELIPDAIVEDDSSWIQWNRVHDFYDDHPYGNNHTWVQTLDRLKKHIEERDTKPLVLGESIAADTWVSPESFQHKGEPPFHHPWFVESNREWLKQMKSRDADLTEFADRTRNYAHLMRKFQIETYRHQVVHGGYVVSVIRDFPKAAMGLIDFQGRPKWTPDDWQFQTEVALSLVTPDHRRSFSVGDSIPLPIHVVGNRSEVSKATLHVEVSDLSGNQQLLKYEVGADTEWVSPVEFHWKDAELSSPTRLWVSATLSYESKATRESLQIRNQWPIWVFPPSTIDSDIELVVHASLASDQALVTSLKPPRASSSPKNSKVTVARQLTPSLLDELEQGGRVILIPDGERHSFPVADHWFLRGGPVVFGNRLLPPNSTEMLMELQHFDLAGPVVPNLSDLMPSVDPLLMLWDNHDMRETRTHGLVFSISVGKGRLLVSTLDHRAENNSAGPWLLTQFINRLKATSQDAAQLSENNARRLREELEAKEVDLHTRTWKFKPDEQVSGERDGWFKPDFNDQDWASIQTDRHWDSQGYGELDGWGWYRLTVEPEENGSDTLFLNFTGVDDHYRVWVNGQFVGQDGDIESRQTAFDRRKSFDLSSFVQQGEPIQISVAVYDWYGAGGIFRPVTLSTAPLSQTRPWLKR